jgi:hypothetical protein
VQDVTFLAGHRECKKPGYRIGIADRGDARTVVFGANQSRQPLSRNRRCAFFMGHFADHHREFLLRFVRGLMPLSSSLIPGTLTQGKGVDASPNRAEML